MIKLKVNLEKGCQRRPSNAWVKSSIKNPLDWRMLESAGNEREKKLGKDNSYKKLQLSRRGCVKYT